MPKNQLASHTVENGYASSIPRALMRGFMAFLSKNGVLSGLGLVRAWRGAQMISQTIEKGSRVYFNADGGYAGLGDGGTDGRGSVFRVRNLLVFTGTGPVRFNGQNLLVNANANLSYIRKVAGNYVLPAYQAGHARPSSATIYPKTTLGPGKTAMSGSLATVIWRGDSMTGQTSLPSLPSNVLVLSNGSFIQTFPLPDANGQDFWGIGVPKIGFGTDGNFYALKTELSGEVLESTLSYSRTTATLTIPTNSNVVTASVPTFSAADVGRRIKGVTSTTFDSWITEIISDTQARTADTNTLGVGDLIEAFVIRHAVQGILRAVEISYTTESLIGQPLAPFDAFPPPSNLNFAGLLNDTIFIETQDGIILVGVPTYLGSFPPKSALYPSEPAILYLEGDGVQWRFSKNTLSALSYVGGPKPLALQTIWKNTGIRFAQNAAIGFGGRVILWNGKPMRLGSSRDPVTDFAFRVYRDFEGWDAAQTAQMPVCCGYDPANQLEIWAFKDKIMALHAPSGNWCSPLDITPYLATANDYITSVVTIDNKLRITTTSGGDLAMHKFDEGTGSFFVVQTPDVDSPLQHDTISEIQATISADGAGNAITVKVIKDYNDAAAITAGTITLPNAQKEQHLKRLRPNIVNAKSHAVRVEMQSNGTGDAGVQKIETYGESSNIFIG